MGNRGGRFTLKSRWIGRGTRRLFVVVLGVLSLATVLAYPVSIRPILRVAAAAVAPAAETASAAAPRPAAAAPKKAPRKKQTLPVASCPITVDAGGGGDYLTIQEAVDNLPNPGPCTVIVKA